MPEIPSECPTPEACRVMINPDKIAREPLEVRDEFMMMHDYEIYCTTGQALSCCGKNGNLCARYPENIVRFSELLYTEKELSQ